MYTRMALRVKPYFLPALWITMAGLTLLTAGDRSRLGEESRDEGLDDSEWGDMGLANGEAPWWSKNRHVNTLKKCFRVLLALRSSTLAPPASHTDLQGSSATVWWQRPT